MSYFLAIPALILFTFLSSCKRQEFQLYAPDHGNIRYSGRVDFMDKREPVLIGSASFVEMSFQGDSCQVLLRKLNPENEHNYISLELDGEDLGRTKIGSTIFEALTIHAENISDRHILKIFKATEAQNNYIAFGGIFCESLTELPPLHGKKIEFIGNSITCGMGNDLTNIPCDSGLWYDQHNAYWAYGPIVARELNTQFLLSSVSGIGIYRNWNSLRPAMPEVFENMYLNTDETRKWDFNSYTPDLVSICLGTNDMSLGDGIQERLPFDSAEYVSGYIDFVKVIYSKYPDTQVCLLTSPMIHDEQGMLLKGCLMAVQEIIDEEYSDRNPVAVFEFPSEIVPHGCSYHPNINDHKQIAAYLVAFYREVMHW